MTELHRLGIAGLAAAYAAGEATASAVVEHHLARIDAFDPKLRAFIEVDRGGALAAAEESDRRIATGAARGLEGVPVAIKANIAVAGLEWNAGMDARRGIVAERDAEAVGRLRGAGAVILGTLNMQEAALGATTDNVWFGRALNPHGEGLTPGGSSGGSGSAVAAGLCVASLGTDTLGSIRIPAAYNGVYGLKPTNGSVSAEGLVAVSERFDTIGPLARSIDDLEAVWEVIRSALRPSTSLGTSGVERIILLDGLAGVECEPAVVDGYHRALAALDLPRETLRLDAPLKGIRTAAFIDATRELIGHLGAMRPERQRLSDELAFLLDHAEARTPEKLARDRATIDAARAAMRANIPAGTMLLTPTTPQAAFVQGGEVPLNQADFCALANVAGLPALSLPSGRNDRGRPVAVQLIGWPGSEDALFAVARTLDAALGGYGWPEGY